MTFERRKEILKMVREQLARHVDEDAEGGELFMKEVREGLVGKKELAVAKNELREISYWLRRDTVAQDELREFERMSTEGTK